VSGSASVRIGGDEHRITVDTALWMPAGTVHAVRVSDDAVLLPVVAPADRDGDLPRATAAVPMTPALRRAAFRQVRAHMFRSPEQHVHEVLDAARDALVAGPVPPLPRSRAAAEVARRLLADPGAHVSLARWADDTFVSEATLRRAFAAETGLTFTAWLTHARLAASLPLLEQGMPVRAVAARVGYGSASGFIAAFRARFGCTPGEHRDGGLAQAS